MRRYLSVDCGGTKTAFLLCRETGELEAACTLGPGNYMVNGIDHVLSVLKDGILQICCQAAIAQSEITHSFIAIAGFKDIPADVPVLTRLVRETFSEDVDHSRERYGKCTGRISSRKTGNPCDRRNGIDRAWI